MADRMVVKAETDVTIYVWIYDTSANNETGLTGLVYNSAGLTCYYVRPLAAAAALTLATQTVTGAHSDGGFVEIDSTNMPGLYRLDLSDAICATGVDEVTIMLQGATNMADTKYHIQLTDFDVNDATPAVNVTEWNSSAVATPDKAGFPVVTIEYGTGTGEMIITNGYPSADIIAISGDTVAAINAELFFDNTGFNASNSTVGTVTTLTGHTPQTGDSSAKLGTISDLGSGATVGANLADIEAQTDDIGAAGAGLTAVPWNAVWDAEVQSEVNDALVALGLDHLVSAAVVGADITDDSIIAQLVSASATADWDSFDNTTDSIEALRTFLNTFNNISAGDVNAQVLDVLATDTFAESSSIPAATASLKDKLVFLATLARNKITETATTQTLYADDGSTPVGTSTVSDDGTTTTRGEYT